MATIVKWGKNLAVRIPAVLATQLQVAAGTPVDLEVRNGYLLVRPQRKPKYRLKDLLKNCKPNQLHGEIDFGPDMGRESSPP
jgi:antitoxin MazE